MRYSDINEKHGLLEGFIDPNEDEFMKAHEDDSRKPALTLKQINKLKKIRATNELENTKKKSLISVMYGMPNDEDGGEF